MTLSVSHNLMTQRLILQMQAQPLLMASHNILFRLNQKKLSIVRSASNVQMKANFGDAIYELCSSHMNIPQSSVTGRLKALIHNGGEG